jgi:hypothetical protein
MTLTMGIVAMRPLNAGKLLPIWVQIIMTATLIRIFMRNSMHSPIVTIRILSIHVYTYLSLSGSLKIAFGFMCGSWAQEEQ